MFALTQTGSFKIDNPIDTYVYEFVAVERGIVVTSSDDALRLINPLALNSQPLGLIHHIHEETTSLQALDSANSIVCTAGRDSKINIFDLRLPSISARIHEVKTDAPILSLACLSSTFSIAAGTELINSQAAVYIWDTRNLKSPRVKYVESHSDDVTKLEYHPSNTSILLSGSTDGLLNLYDTSIVDEEDALHQTINHGFSIHRAGFLNDMDIFALSHDEQFSIYQMVNNPEDSSEDVGSIHFGDLREHLGCDYVANLLPRPNGGAVLGVGTHTQERFNLVHLGKTSTWSLDMTAVVTLPGAHGGEVVRAFCFLDQFQMVLTGGEDSQVKIWSSST